MRWVILAALTLAGTAASGAEWHVDRAASGNRVQFTSEVVGFSFSGETDQVDGFLYWEGDSLFQSASQVRVEVDLNSLDTGIGKRDRDMRDLLQTREFPKAVFTGTVLEHSLADTLAGVVEVVVGGTMALRGVAREFAAPATIRAEGDRWRVDTEFTLHLPDHQIAAPKLAAFVKVSEEVRIAASFVMQRVDGEETGR